MTWTPHTDSTNVGLSAGTKPTAELRIKYETENTPNGALIAFIIAFFVSFTMAMLWGYQVYYSANNSDGIFTFTDSNQANIYYGGGFLAILIFFFVFRWVLLLFLMPGNIV